MKGLNAMACQKVDSNLKVTTIPTPAGLATATKTGAASYRIEKVSWGAFGLSLIAAVLLSL
jgi:hypothetical protein